MNRDVWIPSWLYKVLPLMYLILGVLFVFLPAGASLTIIGICLIVYAGWLIYKRYIE